MTQISNNEIQHRLERLENEIENIKEDITTLQSYRDNSIKLEIQYKNIEKMLLEVRDDVKNLQAKPVKYWDGIIKIIITIAVTALVSHIIHL